MFSTCSRLHPINCFFWGCFHVTEISVKWKSSPEESRACGELAANNVLRFERIAFCNWESDSPFLPPAEPQKRDLLFHARGALALEHLRSRIPTASRKSVRRPIRLPPNRARRAVGSRKSLQRLRRRASWPRRTGAIAASLTGADEPGSVRGTTKTVVPGKTIASTVAADCDKTPTSNDRAATTL